jgi:tetratricopeptide (TPR) repeat protein
MKRARNENEIDDTQPLAKKACHLLLTSSLPMFRSVYNEYKKSCEYLRKQHREDLVKEVGISTTDPVKLAKIFSLIADSNIELIEKSSAELKLQYYNDAASACQYVLKLDKDSAQRTEVYSKLNSIQNNIVTLCGGALDKLELIKSQTELDKLCNKTQLQDLRDYTKTELQKIEANKALDQTNYMSESIALFREIAERIAKYLAGLYQKAEGIIGIAPCEYTVIGLSSMALQQTTPYSDLEHAILTANDNYKTSEDPLVKNYFKNLGHLVHFMVINLGETIIPTSAYSLDLSRFIPKAVSFDLGGKTPIGRIERDKPYELIQTVEGMLDYLKNERRETDYIDKHLTIVLQKSCFVYGNKTLESEYQKGVQEFFLSMNVNGQQNCEERAIQVLRGGREWEFDYANEDYLKPSDALKKRESYFKQFSFDSSYAEKQLFNVKDEIYRMSDRFIYYFSLLYGEQEGSSWDTLDKLCEREIISHEGMTRLKKALTFATNLRLKAYDHYGCQEEKMDFISKTHSQNQKKELSRLFKLKEQDLEADGDLLEYYKTVIPLRRKLIEYCDGNVKNKDKFFAHEAFYSNDHKTIVEIHLRLSQYNAALQQLLVKQELLGKEHTKEVALNFNDIGVMYDYLNEHQKALTQQQQALQLVNKLSGEKRLKLAIFHNLGVTYGHLGKHQEALEQLQEALKLVNKLPDEESLKSAIFHHLGTTYSHLGKHQEALEQLHEALKLVNKLPGEDRLKSTIFHNLGVTYSNLGDNEQALNYQLQALSLREKILGEKHLDVAATLNSLGLTYINGDNSDQALEPLEKAIEIREKILGREHRDVAISLFNKGVAFGRLNDATGAMGCYQEALEIMKRVLGEKHPYVATIYSYMGSSSTPKSALYYHKQALKIREEVLDKNHPDAVASLTDKGVAYIALSRYNKAKNYLLKALNLKKDHSSIVTDLLNIEKCCYALGEYNKALKYCEEALYLHNTGKRGYHALSEGEKSKVLNLNKKDPLCLIILNNISSIYNTRGGDGDAEQALKYQLKELELSINLQHPSIMKVHEDIVDTYVVLGNSGEALKYKLQALELEVRALPVHEQNLWYHQEELKLKKELLGPEHHEVTMSLTKVGNAYGNSGNHKKALKYHLEALKLQKELKHPDVVIGLNNVGIAFANLGNHKKALECHQEELKLKKELLGPEHSDVAISLHNIGAAYYFLGQDEEALPYFQEELDLLQKFEKTHPRVLEAQQTVNLVKELINNSSKRLAGESKDSTRSDDSTDTSYDEDKEDSSIDTSYNEEDNYIKVGGTEIKVGANNVTVMGSPSNHTDDVMVANWLQENLNYG